MHPVLPEVRDEGAFFYLLFTSFGMSTWNWVRLVVAAAAWHQNKSLTYPQSK